ncbi:MAG: hypothetical protein R3300_02800 [Candidatus Promineifilaceae bacterium]|nr:hypothetical protein [Candidatus Promineifilaceae bacterium]
MNAPTEQILALTDAPDVTAWRPFGSGPTLKSMVDAFNHRSRQRFALTMTDLLPGCESAELPILRFVLDGSADWWAGRLPPPDDVTLLMLDLSTANLSVRTLSKIREWLADRKQRCHLMQVGGSEGTVSWAELFQQVTIFCCAPPVICRHWRDFDLFLDDLLAVHLRIWQGVLQNPFDVPCLDSPYSDPHVHPRHGHFVASGGEAGQRVRRAFAAYHSELAGLVSQTRDVALFRALNPAQTVNLGQAAAVQAFLLAYVAEQVRPKWGGRVNVSPITRPLVALPAEAPLTLRDLQSVTLVMVQLCQTNQQPTLAQCQAMDRLGLVGGAVATVHYDQPQVWAAIGMLPSFVQADSFEIEFPNWHDVGRSEVVGLNESIFGVSIEESFAHGLDDFYLRYDTKALEQSGEDG